MLRRWLGLAALVVVLDQISKLWVSSHFVYLESVRILSVFDIALLHNAGAAFSFLSEAGGMQRWLFTAIAVIASVAITLLLRKH
ncbi:MAG: signal peptidase II, partial [Gallionella sp.]|nr:signal peptidase II [Gallionella sp.]